MLRPEPCEADRVGSQVALKVKNGLPGQVTNEVSVLCDFWGDVGGIGYEFVNPISCCLVETCAIIPVQLVFSEP